MWKKIFAETLKVSVICVLVFSSHSAISAQTKRQENLIEFVDQKRPQIEQTLKISVNQDGLQRVSRAELLTFGFDSVQNSSRIKLFADGIEQPIRIYSDGTLEFFGQKLETLWSDRRIYWLTNSGTAGKRIPIFSTEKNSRKVTNSIYTAVSEFSEKKYMMSNISNGEAENFFGSIINATPLDQSLNATNIPSTDFPATLEIAVQGASNSPHYIRVLFNDVEIGLIQGDYQAHFVKQFPLAAAQLREGANTIRLVSGASNDVSLVDYLRLTYPRTVSADNHKLRFILPANKSIIISGFAPENFRVFDATDSSQLKELSLQQKFSPQGSLGFMIPAISTERVIWAQENSGFHPPEIVADVASNLRSSANTADFVIITHKNFAAGLEPLRQQRENEGLRTKIVNIEDVYDEFSFGAKNPHAIYSFLKFAKNTWQAAPKYVMLVGDSTIDARNYLGNSPEDLMPTFATDYNFGEASSDDLLTDFNEDGIADMPIGRLSVRTAAETATVVNKILTYENLPNDFTFSHGSTFVNDTPYDYDFGAMTSDIQSALPIDMNRQTINRASGTSAEIRTQVLNSINEGKGIVNFLGHGTLTSWTGAQLLRASDTPALSNGSNLSIFVALACLNGAFAESNESLAEGLQRSPNGGGVAILAASGSVYPFGLIDVSKDFYNKIMTRPNIRIGDAIQEAKATTEDNDIRRLIILFGDPTMRIKNGR